MSSTVNVNGLDLRLGGFSGDLRVGQATAAGGSATATLAVDGDIRGTQATGRFGNHAVGVTNAAGATAVGTVSVGGDLLGRAGMVGAVFNANGSTATGSLTVGGNLLGPETVGFAFAPAGAASTAGGTVTVQTGNVTEGDGNLAEGWALLADTTATGSNATARMALEGSTLDVGLGIGIGDFTPGSRGELALTQSTGTVGGNVRVGLSANNRTLFGDGQLALSASLLRIAGNLLMDTGAELLFGVESLARGLGGYGAIDAESAILTGLIAIDFAGLFDDLGFTSADFDLIKVDSGFVGDFTTVSLLNLPAGYFATYRMAVEGEGDVWRVTLTQAVPEPGALALLLMGMILLSGLGLRPARLPAV